MTVSGFLNVRPSETEVAVINLPHDVVARVHHPGGVTRELNSANLYCEPDKRLIVTVCGDAESIGWGSTVGRYYTIRQVCRYLHQIDQPVWDGAAKAIRRGGIAYVQYERTRHYGRERWTATGFRIEQGEPE